MTVATITVLDALAAQQLVNCLPGLGQALMASSLPVTLASNQSALSVNSTVVAALPAGSNVIGGVTQSGTWNIGTVTGVTTVSTVTSLSQFGGNSINLGAGAVGTGTLRITQASDSPLVTAMGAVADAAWTTGSGSQIALLKAIAGAAIDTTTQSPVKVLTYTANSNYETVAASQTDQALGATGATGDYLSHVLIVPATTSPGAVSIKDGSGSAITIFTGGASSVTNLVPFVVPVGAKSTGGAWKVTTGASVSAIGFGSLT